MTSIFLLILNPMAGPCSDALPSSDRSRGSADMMHSRNAQTRWHQMVTWNEDKSSCQGQATGTNAGHQADMRRFQMLCCSVQAPGYGIDSIASVFTDFGYKQQDELNFPKKHLRALWFSPPDKNSKLPRIFISELKVTSTCLSAHDMHHLTVSQLMCWQT